MNTSSFHQIYPSLSPNLSKSASLRARIEYDKSLMQPFAYAQPRHSTLLTMQTLIQHHTPSPSIHETSQGIAY
ncbi:hypothetical protein EAE96_006948 [Botrytis aclada]|nr:hypothetical protein EAE96_006948 [Botrytis aclada]